MNISKFMLFLLCFLLVFNFCLKPYTVEAVVPTVIGGKLLTFLLAMAAAGVTLSVAGKSDSQLATEANKLMQEFEQVNGQIEFWQDALLNYLKNKGYQAANSFTSLLDKIKNWIVELGSVEGSNSFADFMPMSGYVDGYTYELDFQYSSPHRVEIYMTVDGYPNFSELTYFSGGDSIHFDYFNILEINYKDDQYVIVIYSYSGYFLYANGKRITFANPRVVSDFIRYGSISYDENPFPDTSIDYNVDSTAYPLTGVPPNYYNKPNVLPPPVPTTTWDLTTGRNVTTWPGTAEDFADDFADTVTWDDYRDLTVGFPSTPYSLDETVPGTLTIDYDYTDEVAGAIPVPYPDTYEGDIPSEGLLQGITNWITSLINIILGIPAKLIALLKELLITLFVPDVDFMQNKMNDVNLKIGSKIGDNDYMNFLDSLKSLEGEPIPDGYIGNNKVFDASYVNNLADMVKLWQRWFWYILIVLWYMNNVYKMIRGSDAVRGMEYDAHRGGAKS